MTRFRVILATAVVTLVAVVAIVALTHPAPVDETGSPLGGSGGLIPVDQRVPAPELTGITGWVNSPALHLHDGTPATLVDFWTFSCVNCVRTLPHLHALLARYSSRGLRVIGVHSPEFDFEKDPGNVRAAVARLQVTWPVALDPEMATWTAFGTRYWPEEFLVDGAGRVAYVHIGEGDDERTDAAVRGLVGAPAPAGTEAPSAGSGAAPDTTPELYLGSVESRQHGTPLGDGEELAGPGKVARFPASSAPATERDAPELSGAWIDRGDRVEAGDGGGHLRLRLHARDVFLVAGSAAGAEVTATVTVDGALPTAATAGDDAPGGLLRLAPQRLYSVLRGLQPGDHVLDLAVPAGTLIYTLTFG